MREDEAKETWKAMDDAKVQDFKDNSIFASWGFHGGELVKTGYNITRVTTCSTMHCLYEANSSLLVWPLRSPGAQSMAQGARYSRWRRSPPNEPCTLPGLSLTPS